MALVEYKRFRIYLWIAFAYFLFWLLVHSAHYPDTFLQRALNNIWRISYLIILNYLLFEHIISFIGRKRKTIFYNILIAVPVIFMFLMLYSGGLYAWRLLGIIIGIYTPLATFKSVDHAVEDQMAFSVMSIFFFGIIIHIYDYVKLKQSTQQLRIEKQAAELKYLKSQTNSHSL
jgi:cbb3-type cytochrome oxidase subunit 3